MTINTRAEYDTALARQAALQRDAASDPNKQRELQELTTQLDAYRTKNPQAAQGGGGLSKEEDERLRLSGQSVYDPDNTNNASKPGAEGSVNDRRSAPPASSRTPAGSSSSK